jgi:glucose-6-phosphate isomerase
MLALLGVWYINFFQLNTHAVLPYDQGLSLFPSYLQQADMESNGKFIDRNGEKIQYHSGPILWGESGTNGQHAFYQLIHQGTEVVPSDFIMPIHSHYSIGNNGNEHHKILIANFIAQTQSLMMGKTDAEARAELKNQSLDEDTIKTLTPHKTFEGNRPSTSILFDKLTPKSLGRIIAIYEHKIFTQGVIWNINSFDQWGVEYGKQIAKLVLPKLIEPNETSGFDSSTNNLINYTKKNI